MPNNAKQHKLMQINGKQSKLMGIVAHPCGDPNRATQYRAYSVASSSRSIRDVAPKSRYTPPNQGVAPFCGPPCRTFLSFAAGRERGGLVEGIAALVGSGNGSRNRGVSQLQSHQSRYSVPLRRRLAAAGGGTKKAVTSLHSPPSTASLSFPSLIFKSETWEPPQF